MILTSAARVSRGCEETLGFLYHSTRSDAHSVTGKFAIRTGIAPDGGLYVRDGLEGEHLDLTRICNSTFQETSLDVLARFLTDFSHDELAACVSAAYGATFDDERIAPVRPLGSDYMLELFHGPTSAFKDVALQMLPHLMLRSRAHEDDKILVLTATSGDTGKAALEGFAGIDGVGICVFYPYRKVSDVQELQMVCQTGSNVGVCAVRGTFDDSQTGVKRIFGDAALIDALAQRNVALSSANSINIGRLVPQIAYYIDAYAQLVRAGAVTLGEKVDFCVPTGNFGNVLAGFYAELMGLPVGTLIVASNTNNVLTDFITTGTYDRRRAFNATISPSMDILVSSNLERLLYHLSGGDCDYVASLMADLAEKGAYTVSDELKERIGSIFGCGYATDAETSAAIRSTYGNTGVLIDPHTAVGKHVLDGLETSGRARVLVATASPYKFSADCLKALGHDAEDLSGFEAMDALEQLTGTAAPLQLSSLRSMERLHDDVCAIERMGAFVESVAARIFA